MTAHHPMIAVIAQKSANLASDVVMVDRHPNRELVLVSCAYRTPVVLPCKKFVILLDSKPVETT